MKTIERLIKIAGGLGALEEHSLHVYKPPFMPLHIRYLGIGPREQEYVAVAQLIPYPGTEKLESELCFEIGFWEDGVWCWCPVSYRQSAPAFFHTCVCQESDGQLGWNYQTEEGLNVLAKAWDDILVSRGYGAIKMIL